MNNMIDVKLTICKTCDTKLKPNQFAFCSRKCAGEYRAVEIRRIQWNVSNMKQERPMPLSKRAIAHRLKKIVERIAEKRKTK